MIQGRRSHSARSCRVSSSATARGAFFFFVLCLDMMPPRTRITWAGGAGRHRARAHDRCGCGRGAQPYVRSASMVLLDRYELFLHFVL